MVIKKICYALFSIFCVFIFITSYAEEADFVKKNELESQITKLNGTIIDIQKANKELKAQVKEQIKINNEIRSLIETNEQDIKNEINITKEDTGKQISNITKKISERSLIWILSTVLLILLGIITYLLLKNKLSQSSKILGVQILKAREELETEAIKLDSKLTDILETQLKIFNEKTATSGKQEAEIDHTLALRVGEEIHRMRKRLENMPPETKGMGALTNSLMRLEEEFNSNGYEIVDLMGKPWNEGLNVSARFIPSDKLKPGEEIITRIIKPQINYKNNLIRAAEIEVSTGG